MCLFIGAARPIPGPPGSHEAPADGTRVFVLDQGGHVTDAIGPSAVLRDEMRSLSTA